MKWNHVGTESVRAEPSILTNIRAGKDYIVQDGDILLIKAGAAKS